MAGQWGEAEQTLCLHQPKNGAGLALGRRGRRQLDPIRQKETHARLIESLPLAGISEE